MQALEEISEDRKMIHGRRRGNARREPDFHFKQGTKSLMGSHFTRIWLVGFVAPKQKYKEHWEIE